MRLTALGNPLLGSWIESRHFDDRFIGGEIGQHPLPSQLQQLAFANAPVVREAPTHLQMIGNNMRIATYSSCDTKPWRMPSRSSSLSRSKMAFVSFFLRASTSARCNHSHYPLDATAMLLDCWDCNSAEAMGRLEKNVSITRAQASLRVAGEVDLTPISAALL
jgi:hypothetical protein